MLSIKARGDTGKVRCRLDGSVQGGGETVLRISSEPLPAGTSMAYDVCR